MVHVLKYGTGDYEDTSIKNIFFFHFKCDIFCSEYLENKMNKCEVFTLKEWIYDFYTEPDICMFFALFLGG